MDKNMENEMETGGLYGSKDLVASTNMFSWSLASEKLCYSTPILRLRFDANSSHISVRN